MTTMRDDTISRQAAIEALAKNMPSLTTPDGSGQLDHDIYVTYEAYADCMQLICDLPSADVEPVRHGRWVEENPLDAPNCRLIKCSKCGKSFIVPMSVPYEDWIDGRNFCYSCGADMRRSR